MTETSFIIYTDYKFLLQALSLEQRGMVFDACIEYADTLTMPKIDDKAAEGIFLYIKNRMDDNFTKRDKLRENGKKGGRPVKPKDNQTTTKDKPNDKLKEPEANLNANANVNKNANANVNKNEKVKVIKVDMKTNFKILWDLWIPNGRKRQSEKDSLEQYCKAIKNGEKHEDIESGVRGYTREVQAGRQKAEYCKGLGRFIKHKNYTTNWPEPDMQSNTKSTNGYYDSVMRAAVEAAN